LSDETGEKREISLRVAETKQKDYGRGKVRLSVSAMEAIGVEVGDVVELFAKRRSASIAWPAYIEDQEDDLVRMDPLTRQNIGASIGDKVLVRKATYKRAEVVKLAVSASMQGSIQEGFQAYVKKKLFDFVVVQGDKVAVTLLGQPMMFVVVYVRPSGIVKIDDDTQVLISDKPVEELEQRPITYDDIGGLDDVILRVREMIELPMKHPELFRRLGIEPPKGVLLYGPPGVGKTLLAKAVATESEANFISIKGPEIYSKWVGESERAIRSIFRKARQSAPCVVFLDEVESIAPIRGLAYGDSRVSENVISQLLTELDGMEELENIVVLAATNRPDMLDPALLRPGRLDMLVYIPPPDLQARKEILRIHTSRMPLTEDVSLDDLASKTEGYSGADLEELVREAGMEALKRDRNASKVTLQDFERALGAVKPSITDDMVRFYAEWNEKAKKLRRVEKPELLGWI